MNDSCQIPTYITSGAVSADVTGGAIDARHYRVASFTAQWTSTGTPVGVLKIQGTNQNPVEVSSPTWATYYIDQNKYDISDATWASGAITTTGAAGGYASIIVEPVHPWIRFFYDRTSGGTANTSFAVQVHLREE